MVASQPYDARRLIRIVVSLAIYLLACALFVVLRDEGRFPAGVAIVLVAAAGVWLTHVIRIELRDHTPPARIQVILLSALVLVGLALILAWYLTNRSDGWGFFGLATFYLGVGLVVSRARHSTRWSRPIGIFFGVAAVAAVVGGVVSLDQGRGRGALLLVAGLAATAVAISLISADFNREFEREADPRRARWFALVGVVVLVAALLTFVLSFNIATSFVVMFAAALFIVVLGVAARSNADVVLAVVAAAVLLVSGPVPVAVPESATAEPGERVLVALGDSFMSGEGSRDYFENTNSRGVNECRRAPTAYAALVVAEDSRTIPDDLVFLACSGADGVHLYRSAQHPGEPTDDDPESGSPQLANLTWQLQQADLTTDAIDMVLLSVGGNDALFGDIAQICVVAGDCSTLGQAWVDNLTSSVKPQLEEAFAAVDFALPDTPVVVVPYPIPIGPAKSCNYSLFSAAEHAFLFHFTEELNATLRSTAATRRFHFLEPMEAALVGRRLCDRAGPKNAAVNFFATNGVQGLTEQQLNPRHWFHNSMHPNRTGHALMRDVLRDWLIALPTLEPRVSADPSSPPESDPDDRIEEPAVPRLGRACVDDPEIEDCTAAWMNGEQARFLRFPGSLLVPMTVGVWLVALPVIRFWRRSIVPRLHDGLSPFWVRLRGTLRIGRTQQG